MKRIELEIMNKVGAIIRTANDTMNKIYHFRDEPDDILLNDCSKYIIRDSLSLVSNNKKNNFSSNWNNPKETDSPKKRKSTEKEKVYYFTVCEKYSIRLDYYIFKLHKGLKDDLKLIDCTLPEFRNLFSSVGTKKRKTPNPIIWKSGHYSHLTYFITSLKNIGFIPDTRRPSFNQIALELFYDNEEGVFFKTNRFKCDIKNDSTDSYSGIRELVERLR